MIRFLMNDADWQQRTDSWVKAQDSERKEKERKRKEAYNPDNPDL